MYTERGWLRGRDAVRQRFAATFETYPKVHMEIAELHAAEPASGVALLDFRWSVYPSDDGRGFHGVGSGVYVLREGRWREVLEHETVLRSDL